MLTRAVWRTSTYSTGGGNNCVQVAQVGGRAVGVRDSKAPDDGALVLSPESWRDLAALVKAGQLDL
ncbi:DUF397 domain-containing protein [Spirillospora sp. NBC_01491]|uniref:DUF397 domain-containing protein n=1 Tax=Spirillospora sp. NBC_01491 TaxID=2976007 RepID=UPI002E325F20|nr:DUF397 domain-containing protein [Spirillospora sp. NBC_01491]